MGMMKRIASAMTEEALRNQGRQEDLGAFEEFMAELFDIGNKDFAKKYGVTSGLLIDSGLVDREIKCYCDESATVWIHTSEGQISFACTTHHNEIETKNGMS